MRLRKSTHTKPKRKRIRNNFESHAGTRVNRLQPWMTPIHSAADTFILPVARNNTTRNMKG